MRRLFAFNHRCLVAAPYARRYSTAGNGKHVPGGSVEIPGSDDQLERAAISKMTIEQLLQKYMPRFSDAELKPPVDLLRRNLLVDAVQWKELSDADKNVIKDKGLPAAVINSLNKAVRDGMLASHTNALCRTLFR